MSLVGYVKFEPRCEKTGVRGFRHKLGIRWLEACNLGLR